MTPEEIQQMQALQIALSQGDPRLAGNDALRQQYAANPASLGPNGAQWLDERQQHLLGNDAPPIITATAPAPAPPPMLPPQMPATAPNPPVQSLPPPQAPQQPPTLQQPPQAVSAPSLPPPPIPAPPASAPMMPTPAQITPLPQQAPVMSQVSPAPAVAAKANINTSVTEPQRTSTPAYQPPPLPTFLNASLAPNLGGYKPTPSMPGYAMPRTGNPFTAPHASAPQLPSFADPFSGPGGYSAGPSYTAPTQAQESTDLYARLLMPRAQTNFY